MDVYTTSTFLKQLPLWFENGHVTCSWRVLFVTAVRRADSAESGGRVREEVREGEADLQEEEEEPRISASSGAPVVSWSASDDESPSERTVWQEKNTQLVLFILCGRKSYTHITEVQAYLAKEKKRKKESCLHTSFTPA